MLTVLCQIFTENRSKINQILCQIFTENRSRINQILCQIFTEKLYKGHSLLSFEDDSEKSYFWWTFATFAANIR